VKGQGVHVAFRCSPPVCHTDGVDAVEGVGLWSQANANKLYLLPCHSNP
jgi:hypothetical protein